MTIGVHTNIKDLEASINLKFKNMMKSREMTEAGKTASKVMGRHVLDEIASGGDSGYDYEQSGDFHKMMANEARFGSIYQTPSGMSMGFGYIPELNHGVEAKRNFQTQRHWVGGRNSGRYITVNLKQESQMPKWILAEFGSGRKADNVKRTKDMSISYTQRSGKGFMFGPSSGKVGGEGGGRKSGYFMVSKKGMQSMTNAPSTKGFRTHPGVKPGRIFRKGFNSSASEVRDVLGDGISSYLNSLN